MTLREFREVFNGTLMAACGYTADSAEAALERGEADLVAFGRPYLANPDLVERFHNGWPLADLPELAAFESHAEGVRVPPGVTVFDVYEGTGQIIDPHSAIGVRAARRLVAEDAVPVRHPDRVGGCVVVASSARLTSQAIAFDVVGRNAIVHDPGFREGQYYG